MKILVGSYKKDIYEVSLDLKKDKFLSSKVISNHVKPSYLIKDNNISFIYMKDNHQYVKTNDENILISENFGACHISYDDVNKNIYTSFYGGGFLKSLKQNDKNKKWEVNQKINFEKHSHIHYAKYIPTLNLVGVVDLGDNAIHLYKNDNHSLVLKSSFKFDDNYGPRHFVYHKSLPLIYVLNEHIPSITILEYKEVNLTKIDQIPLIDGAGSAIRISNDMKYLYAGVRFSNYIFSFKLNELGELHLIQKISTKGDHPRDFNLINNDKHLVVANMHSDNLVLFKIINGKLYQKDIIDNIIQGASIMS